MHVAASPNGFLLVGGDIQLGSLITTTSLLFIYCQLVYF
jgi:hypothetical protein